MFPPFVSCEGGGADTNHSDLVVQLNIATWAYVSNEMPQGSNSQKGNNKKGRAPAHQNVYAFQHNPKSKKTAKILNSPNINVCKRCFDKIEWRKKYRKYKPRSQPGKCNICEKRTVLAAYHTICTSCTTSEKAYKNMMLAQQQGINDAIDNVNDDDNNDDNDKWNTKVNIHYKNEVIKQLAHSTGELSVDDDDVDDDDDASGRVVLSNAWWQQRRVCAMCVKEAALLPNENENCHETTVNEAAREQNQRLKLRERISLERKLLREQEQAKQVAKEVRRREREMQAGQVQMNKKDVVHTGNYGKHVTDDVSDDDEDPFLLAVGGESKLLTGEAYQQMLLEQEQQKGLNDG